MAVTTPVRPRAATGPGQGRRPVLLGLAGDSASGKSTLTRGIEWILGPDRVTRICADDYHRHDRKRRAELGLTPLDPAANDIGLMERHVRRLAMGLTVVKPVYDHATGEFGEPERVEPRGIVILEGLLPFHTQALRDRLDVKVYLDPEEELRHRWKIERDCAVRGYLVEEVVSDLRRREAHAEAHVRPQRDVADLVVRFHQQGPDDPWTGLGARIALRPTLPYPELRDLIASLPRNGHHPVRFLLGRDARWPDPVVEIDGDCPPSAPGSRKRYGAAWCPGTAWTGTGSGGTGCPPARSGAARPWPWPSSSSCTTWQAPSGVPSGGSDGGRPDPRR